MNNTFSTGYYSQKFLDNYSKRIKIPEYKQHPFEHAKDIIKNVVGEHFGLESDWTNVKTRKIKYRLPRQWCHFWAMEFNQATLSRVALYYGRKDHATALHSVKVINNALFVLKSGTATDCEAQEHFRKMKGMIDIALSKLKPGLVKFNECRNLCRQRLVHKRAGRYYRLRTMKMAQL